MRPTRRLQAVQAPGRDTGARPVVRAHGLDRFDEALRSALFRLCAPDPALVAHAIRAKVPTAELRPLGILCGAASIDHAVLGDTLFHADPPGTSVSRLAAHTRMPVLLPTLPSRPAGVRPTFLEQHGVVGAAAFPILLSDHVVAVMDVLSFQRLGKDLELHGVAAVLTHQLRATAERHFGELV